MDVGVLDGRNERKTTKAPGKMHGCPGSYLGKRLVGAGSRPNYRFLAQRPGRMAANTFFFFPFFFPPFFFPFVFCLFPSLSGLAAQNFRRTYLGMYLATT